MKKLIIYLVAFWAVGTAQAQKWNELTKEQKMMKLQEFRDDNQQYLKKLGMTDDQRNDIDNVNICFLSTLDRIDRYGKDDATKEKYAKAAIQARSVQLEAIMGAEKRKQFQDYVTEKLKKASSKS